MFAKQRHSGMTGKTHQRCFSLPLSCSGKMFDRFCYPTLLKSIFLLWLSYARTAERITGQVLMKSGKYQKG
jgi:hypothetical protein